MVKTSTLIYLVDDFNIPSDMILTPGLDKPLADEKYSQFLNILEIDPGEELVKRTLKLLEKH